ncbi:MAG: ankyrin repeat protein [Planctomycetota bacterium]|jgi:ankyrin repeat protein
METGEENQAELAVGEIQRAVRHGDRGAVARLLSDQPQLASAPSVRGGSLLLEAFEREAQDIADLFVNARNDRGITELDLHEACAMGRAGIVQKRLTDDPLLFDEVGPAGFYPLHRAAYRGHADAVSLLLQMGADANVCSENGASLTPLHSVVAGAARFGSTPEAASGSDFDATCRRLMAAGADAHLRMEGDWTAISAAERDGLHGLLPVLRPLPLAEPSPSREDLANQTLPGERLSAEFTE